MESVQVRRWTREEYEKIVEAGIFAPGTRAELIDGEIISKAPQKSRHAAAIRASEEALRRAFPTGFDVQTQLPLALDPSSEPEPDLSVVLGSWRDYRETHPSSAVLMVEVVDTSLEYDRDRKGNLYARAGIPEYWIINLPERCVEVYRQPEQGIYRTSRRFLPGETISPLAAPDATIPVESLIP
jgi:Uma2 family endonuclease